MALNRNTMSASTSRRVAGIINPAIQCGYNAFLQCMNAMSDGNIKLMVYLGKYLDIHKNRTHKETNYGFAERVSNALIALTTSREQGKQYEPITCPVEDRRADAHSRYFDRISGLFRGKGILESYTLLGRGASELESILEKIRQDSPVMLFISVPKDFVESIDENYLTQFPFNYKKCFEFWHTGNYHFVARVNLGGKWYIYNDSRSYEENTQEYTSYYENTLQRLGTIEYMGYIRTSLLPNHKKSIITYMNMEAISPNEMTREEFNRLPLDAKMDYAENHLDEVEKLIPRNERDMTDHDKSVKDYIAVLKMSLTIQGGKNKHHKRKPYPTSKRSQKGAGASCGKGSFMTETHVCPERIRELETVKSLIETLLQFAGDDLDEPTRQHYNQGIQMLNTSRLLEMIARSDQLYNMFLTKKQELTLMILGYWLNRLQDTNPNNSLFRPSIEGLLNLIPLTYELVNEANNDCGECPITLEPIENGKGVKISHTIQITVHEKDASGNIISSTTKNETFSICLSNKIFDEEPIKKAMAEGKTFMKHPLLRDQAFIDLNKVIRFFPDLMTTRFSPSIPEVSKLPQQQSGGLKLKRTDKKITLNGRERTVYVGKHNKQFVQLNRQYVPVSSLTTHKKASK